MMVRLTFRIACGVALLFYLGGCADEVRVREIRDSMGRQLGANRARAIAELAAVAPCCESLATARVDRKLGSDTEVGFSLGVWPTKRVVDIAGFRTYFEILEFSEHAGGRILEILSTESYLQGFDSATGTSEKELIVPVLTFLDVNRVVIATENAVHVGNVAHNARFQISAPSGAVFAAIHTSREQFSSVLSGAPVSSTGAFPVGSGMIVIRGPGVSRYVPAVTGMVRVRLK